MQTYSSAWPAARHLLPANSELTWYCQVIPTLNLTVPLSLCVGLCTMQSLVRSREWRGQWTRVSMCVCVCVCASPQQQQPPLTLVRSSSYCVISQGHLSNLVGGMTPSLFIWEKQLKPSRCLPLATQLVSGGVRTWIQSFSGLGKTGTLGKF